MRVSIPVLLSLALLLSACGKSSENPAPAASTAAVAASVPAAESATTPAAEASSAPDAVTSSAVAGATTVAPSEATTAGPERAGEVALAQGSVTDTASDGSSRQLKDGDDVYPGDSFVLGSDSYLDLDLEDTGRILLRPNTDFQIKSFHYEADAHDPSNPTDANGQPLIKPQQPENAFFRLIKGGLRAIDGVIGHTSPQNYGVETPVATIGVRGTAFDVRYCGDDCTDEADSGGKPDNGLYTSVSDGSVDVKNDDGDVVTPAGHSGFVKSRKQRMQALKTPPKALRHMDLPPKLKPRADKNRGNLRIKRQKRRELIKQRRRHAAAARAKAAAQGKPLPPAAKPAPKDQKPATPAEKRQQRREERQGQRQGKTAAPAALTHGKAERLQQRGQKLREQEDQKQRAAPAGGPGRGGPAARDDARPKSGEKLRERRQERQEKQQADKPAQPQADLKKDKPGKAAADKCKDKKKRKKDKDKDKCGGG
jgi:hypothetical protein